jgi:MFS family permease
MSAEITPATPPAASAESRQSLRYAWYVVGVLTLAYVFSFIDRQIFSLLVGPLRRDLHISDTQISLLQGLSFALFYTFFGIPIGRLADIRSRRLIITLGMLLWSVLTAGCGLAQTFMQMLFLRMGVGVGEAALSPAAYSLITDYFPRRRLATAISVYSMGIYIGSGLSFLVGGLVVGYASTRATWTLPLLGTVRSWQLIFLTLGLPGAALAPLLFTVREPDTRRARAQRLIVPLRQVVSYIHKNRGTFLLHNIGFGLLSLGAYAGGAWIPEFFHRHFHWNIRTAGIVFGVNVGVFGSLGIIGAGWIADHLRSRGRANANLFVGAIVAILLIPINCAAFLSWSPVWAAVFLAPLCLLSAAPFGIAPAAIQEMMPADMRGQASAIYLFILNLIGLGIGPTAIAVCTQYIFRRDDAVHYSLALVTNVACALGGVLLYSALKPFLASLERLRVWNLGHSAPVSKEGN